MKKYIERDSIPQEEYKKIVNKNLQDELQLFALEGMILGVAAVVPAVLGAVVGFADALGTDVAAFTSGSRTGYNPLGSAKEFAIGAEKGMLDLITMHPQVSVPCAIFFGLGSAALYALGIREGIREDVQKQKQAIQNARRPLTNSAFRGHRL